MSYIKWYTVPTIQIDPLQWNELIDELEAQKKIKKDFSEVKTTNTDTYLYYYVVKNNGTSMYLYCFLNGFKCYSVFINKLFASEGESKGTKALNEIKSEFQLYNKITMQKYFGVNPNTYELSYAIKNCVPSPINWHNPGYKDKDINHIWKADVSSAYGAELAKEVPTLKDYRKLFGRVEPTAEYPFAFYINSYHMAIYNEGTTFELWNSDFYRTNGDKECLYKNRLTPEGYLIPRYKDIKPEEDITILCKSGGTPFAKMMQYYYDNRKEHPEFKDIMNMSIGAMQKNSSPLFSFISAVVLFRCSYNMYNRLLYLTAHKLVPQLVCTDSIAWRGGAAPELTTNIKNLGNFVIEGENINMIHHSCKVYQLKVGNEVTTKWAGVKGIKDMNLPYKAIMNPEIRKKYAPKQWLYDTINNKFIEGEEDERETSI